MTRILLVEDDAAIRQIMVSYLEGKGCEVVACENPTEAIPRLGESFTAVLTDNDMPKMSGLEFIGAIRKLGLKLPIMMLSGTVDPEIPKAVRALNARFFEKSDMGMVLRMLASV